MGSLREHNPSLWVATTPETAYPELRASETAEIAVVGAGITGLTTALLLRRAGADVVLIEAGRIASGATGYTTAKVTSLHGTIYSSITESLGAERARAYGEANEAGLAQVAELVSELDIDCDFTRAPNYTYTEDPELVERIEAEVEAAQAAGLPASSTRETDLPFPVQAAVRFEEQAMFHPRRYCLGLAAAFVAEGGRLHEMTRMVDVDDDDEGCVVTTTNGEVRAERVVMATHLPHLQRGMFYAKTHPERSYVLAVEVDGEATSGMYLSTETPTRSIRPHLDGEQRWLLIGGEGHKVGQDEDTRRRYAALESWARERYDVRSAAYRWSAQDFMPADGIPYVGRVTADNDRLYVATGFAKWGMSNGTAAGMILGDVLVGRDNPWAETFDATRKEPTTSVSDFVKENVNVAERFIGDRLGSLTAPSADGLEPGTAGMVRVDGEKVAGYRDGEGVLHAVSPHCTHMGCLVTFNAAEVTWDCPCHGSRFDVDGRVIQGPATTDLDAKHEPS